MEKEILTMAIIKKELRRSCWSGLLVAVIFLPFYAFMCWVAVFILSLFINIIVFYKSILNAIVVILFVLCGLVYLQVFSSSIYTLIKVLKGDFQISSDWVVDKLEARYGKYNHRPNTLVFARSGNFGLGGDVYEWSKLYAMSEESFFDRTQLDEDFYVVGVGKRKCILAYSKKYFKLEE